jgi:hypothetical protein
MPNKTVTIINVDIMALPTKMPNDCATRVALEERRPGSGRSGDDTTGNRLGWAGTVDVFHFKNWLALLQLFPRRFSNCCCRPQVCVTSCTLLGPHRPSCSHGEVALARREELEAVASAIAAYFRVGTARFATEGTCSAV